MKKYLVALSAILLLAAIIISKNKKNEEYVSKKTRPSVTVMTVTESKNSTIIKSIGTAISNESANIMSNVTQIVSEIHFSDCDSVKKGQLLVQLNIAKKEAKKKQAEINCAEQQRELSRLEILKKKRVIPDKDYDLQKTKLLDAQAKLEAINAEVRDSSIVAPFDGVLGIRNVSIGTLLMPGNIITTIDNIDKLKVDFPVPEKYSTLLKPKLKITAKSVAFSERKFEGNIIAVVPRISPTSRSISVRGIIDNKDHLLKPGMALKISVKLQDQAIVRIPEKSLFCVGEKHYVYTVKDNKVKLCYVTMGNRKNGLVEIEKGILSGDRIVVDGVDKLGDGAIVIISKDVTKDYIQTSVEEKP
ncbi:MAG: efflux RND transporter periplasmic adaptor subunit [Holosporaceae bacterium]|jgi:membrane fusion protein (multidrug efflux system)|nr:efflux RND transporter periplasmic adaptor subunit [Holosporaceae bacterium]